MGWKEPERSPSSNIHYLVPEPKMMMFLLKHPTLMSKSRTQCLWILMWCDPHVITTSRLQGHSEVAAKTFSSKHTATSLQQVQIIITLFSNPAIVSRIPAHILHPSLVLGPWALQLYLHSSCSSSLSRRIWESPRFCVIMCSWSTLGFELS